MIMPKNKKSEGTKRYVIYTRCSTDDQAQGDFTTLDAQAHHCKNMLDAFGYEMANIGKKGVVNDDGFSGKDLNRPGIQKILEDVNKKKRSFDGIIFFRLDRLTRNPRDLYSLIDLFRDNDIDFISVRENLDSSTAIGRVVIGILGLLSAFERELTGERVKASALARVRQGRWVGGQLPYGYKLIPDGERLPNGTQPNKIIVDEDVAPKLKLAWELAADNKSLTEIGLELQKRDLLTSTNKPWRRQSLSHLIKNPFYKGYIHYSGEMHKGTHQAIVDDKLWERANRILTAKLPGHNFVPKAKEYIYLLAGLLKCGDCGSHMMCNFAGGRGKRKFFYYECNRAKQALGCSNKRISATVFDQAVIDYFKRASNDQEIITRAIGNAILESQLKLETLITKTRDTEEYLNTLRHESKKLLDLAMEGTIPQGSTFKDKMTALETKIEQVDSELSKLQAQKRIAQMNAHSGEFLHHNIRFAMQYLDKAPAEAQKSLLRALIKDIVIYEDKIAVNMFISEPLQDILPSTLQGIAPQKEKRPTETCEALTDNRPVSDSCQNWLPTLDSRRNWAKPSKCKEIRILVKMYRRRGRGTAISLYDPLPPLPQAPRPVYKNIVAMAVQVREYLVENPQRTQTAAGNRFGITRARVSQLMTILEKLPDNFISTMKTTEDQSLLKRFSGKTMLKISSLKNIDDRKKRIDSVFGNK